MRAPTNAMLLVILTCLQAAYRDRAAETRRLGTVARARVSVGRKRVARCPWAPVCAVRATAATGRALRAEGDARRLPSLYAALAQVSRLARQTCTPAPQALRTELLPEEPSVAALTATPGQRLYINMGTPESGILRSKSGL